MVLNSVLRGGRTVRPSLVPPTPRRSALFPRVAQPWLLIGGGVCLSPANAETLDPDESSRSERAVATAEVDEDWVVEDSSAEEHNPSDTAAALTTIHIDESIPQSADLTQLIDSASGTTIVQLGGLGDFAGLSIRGSSLQQVEVFLDGIPLNPDGASTVNLAELPLWAFQRIEIYRSLPPLWMGSAAMGGAVNLVSTDRPSQGQISGTIASHQTGRMHAATGYQAPETPLDILFFADAFSTESNFEYFDDNGTIYNTSMINKRRNNNGFVIWTVASLVPMRCRRFWSRSCPERRVLATFKSPPNKFASLQRNLLAHNSVGAAFHFNHTVVAQPRREPRRSNGGSQPYAGMDRHHFDHPA